MYFLRRGARDATVGPRIDAATRWPAVEEREQGVEIDGLDQVVVEARLLRAASGLLVAVAGDGDEQGLRADLAAGASSPPR